MLSFRFPSSDTFCYVVLDIVVVERVIVVVATIRSEDFSHLTGCNFSGLKYSIAHAQGLENNFNRFGVFVIPAIAYSVSDKVTLASHLGDGLYYNHTWMKDVARSNEFGFDLFHGISFGAYYFF